MKNDIRRSLEQASRYQDFEELMRKCRYTVIKSRGIAFVDDKKVRIKGSEVGFSLSKIEQILQLKKALAVKQAKQVAFETMPQQQPTKYRVNTPVQKLRLQS